MGIRKVVKSCTFDGEQVSLSGNPDVPIINYAKNSHDNLDDSHDFSHNPEKENATFPLVMNPSTITLINRLADASGWTVILYYRDGQTAWLTNCGIVNIPSAGDDGVGDVEVHANVRWS